MIDQLRATLLAALQEHVMPGVSYALVDYPDHSNVGDSALWLGTIAALQAIDCGPAVYVCSRRTYSRRILQEAIGPEGQILLHGGGNFGDVWPSHQLFREQVIRDFPKHRILQLPQSIHFDGTKSLNRARRVLSAHPGVTLMLRDQKSLDLAQRMFDAPTVLAPDAAFGLGGLTRPQVAEVPFVWHSRRDLESPSRAAPSRKGLIAVDWLEERRTLRSSAERGLAWLPAHGFDPPGFAARWLWAAWAARARSRLERGCRLLGRGRVVVTNRLHGHVLCALMGIPHFLSDTKQGKVGAFVDTWTSSLPGLHWCESEEEALERASEAGRD